MKRTGEKPALTGNKSNNRIGNGNYIYGNEPTYWQRVKSFTPPWCSGSGWKDPKINVNRNRKTKYHINNSVSANKAGSKGPLHSMLPNDDVSITTSSNSLNTSEKELENLYQHKDKENCDHKGEICNYCLRLSGTSCLLCGADDLPTCDCVDVHLEEIQCFRNQLSQIYENNDIDIDTAIAILSYCDWNVEHAIDSYIENQVDNVLEI